MTTSRAPWSSRTAFRAVQQQGPDPAPAFPGQEGERFHLADPVSGGPGVVRLLVDIGEGVADGGRSPAGDHHESFLAAEQLLKYSARRRGQDSDRGITGRPAAPVERWGSNSDSQSGSSSPTSSCFPGCRLTPSSFPRWLQGLGDHR